MPLRDTTPTLPGEAIVPGMMPTLLCAGVSSPGQLGPSRRLPPRSTRARTSCMSRIGIPSVMQTTSRMSASTASRMASAASGGGTKMTLQSAPVRSRASATVSKIGRSRIDSPPLPGRVPPATSVPYSIIWPAWKRP